MNKNRRQQLRKLIERMENLQNDLEEIASDEQDYFDLMPENLQGSINGMNSEDALDKMSEAIDNIETAIVIIEEIIE